MMTREPRLDELFRLLDGTESPDECYAILATAWSEGKQSADAALRQQLEEAAKTIERVQKLEESIRAVCGPELNVLSNMNIRFVEKAAKWYQQQIEQLRTELAAVREDNTRLEQLVNEHSQEVRLLEEQLADLQAKLSARTDERDFARQQVIFLEQAPADERMAERITDLQRQLAEAQARVRELEEKQCEHDWIAEAPDAYCSMQAVIVCRKCRFKP